MRQVVLDTETTGLDAAAGHRIIEIGCIELLHRRHSSRNFHQYINPERSVDAGALAVHGIDEEFLRTRPVFADVVDEFLAFVEGSELVIHNADFDVGFINRELQRLPNRPRDIREVCDVCDTLTLARRMHPGQRNSLDALAKRYEIDNSMREVHGALLDARILAEVYLAMTGGQVSLSLEAETAATAAGRSQVVLLERSGITLTVIAATAEEQGAHAGILEQMRSRTGKAPIWQRIASGEADNHTKSP